MKLTIAFVLAAATAISAQISEAYTDQHGITYQAITHESSGTIFGIALPENPTDEFIGQITTRLETGWAGVSFGGGMINNLLWVGWPNSAKEVVGTFRLADSYTVPPPFTAPGPEMTPIYTDTAVNDTHWTHTFICKNCHKWLLADGYEQSFDLAGDFAVMGYAGHTEAIPDDPEDPTSDVQQHNFFGQFGMILSDARSAEYETWRAAALAGPAEPEPTSTVTSVTATATSSLTSITSTITSIPSITSTVTSIPSVTSTITSIPSVTPTPTTIPSQIPETVPRWGQCGGIGYKGPKNCASGSRCTTLNSYYHQCL
ncbi:CBD9-like protein [Ascobolus immersus RN42]|uniref:CBD9-like protein n=1 Tax=Ascobolus immersus RN42 TaxID=1160509 RepID=A0A3N4IMY9_ASCIM|nr:CBD9-like protein [Ascobolus immersus RN42]